MRLHLAGLSTVACAIRAHPWLVASVPMIAATVVVPVFHLLGPVASGVLLAILSAPVIGFSKARYRLAVALGLLSVVLCFFMVSSSYWPPTSTTWIAIAIAEPGKIVLEPSGMPASDLPGLGCTAHAVLADGSWSEGLTPTLKWSLPAYPMKMWSNGKEEYQASALITMGPREWLERSALSGAPFLLGQLDEAGNERHLQAAIQLPTPGDGETAEYTWSWDPTSLTGWGGSLDWQTQQLSCICDFEEVTSYAVSSADAAVIEARRGPIAIIPTEAWNFWLDYPEAEGVGEVSLTTLASESPRFLAGTYDFSRDYIAPELQSVADVWREMSTDASRLVISSKRIRTEQGPFLLLGEQGALTIGGEQAASFDSGFFAIVEPRIAYSEFFVDSLVVSFLTLNDEWACDCPVIWLFNWTASPDRYIDLAILNSLGELRIGKTNHQFEEFDEIRVRISEVSFTNRRTEPSEYVLTGNASAIVLNGETIIDDSMWSQLPSAVQQVVLAILSASLAGAIGVALAVVRRESA